MARLQEVARRAGVSIATVSRVLNKSDKVVPETRAAVEQALLDLGYRPSRVARRLRMNTGHAHLVGLIIPDIQNPFYAEIARGVEDAAYASQYALILCNSDENLAKERFYLDVMQAESVDGIVLPPFDDVDVGVVEMVKTGIPVVCVDRSHGKVKTDLVEVDNYQGALDAMRHLIAKGHRSIGLIEGRAHVSTSRERRRGYVDALKAAGIVPRKELMRAGDFKQESGRVLTNELLDSRKPPTALFVCNNLMTVGAIAALHQRGVRIPADVALVGFDDLPWAEALDPPLTVVRQPAYEVGRQAMELLLKRIMEPDRPAVTVRLLPEFGTAEIDMTYGSPRSGGKPPLSSEQRLPTPNLPARLYENQFEPARHSDHALAVMRFPYLVHVGVLLVLIVLISGGSMVRAADPGPAKPSLVLVLTIDQFRGDYLNRFREYFVLGGLKLLLEGGANFVDCRYRHAVTKTAAGHAVVLTGVHADVHGIINNAWIDRETLKRVNCVDDDSVQILGRADDTGGARLPGATIPLGASPRRLIATTVGDELKLTRGGRSKVIGISSKDRSAILLAGKLADAAYWMDKGRIVTSTHYMKELPAWVAKFNEVGRVDSFFGKTWDRLLPAADYDSLQGPDDVPGESTDFSMGRVFPKRITGGAEKISAAYYDAFENTPYKSEVLVDFARVAVENENLGGRGVTDILCLSFSVNDTIGHNYGPDSHEVMDITLRTDRMLAEFFAFLDRRIGLKNCTIILTADHGVAPIPDRVKAFDANFSAGRVDNVRLLKTCEAALEREFGSLAGGRHWLILDESNLLFMRDVLKEKNVAPSVAENVVRDALLTLDFVAAAYTRNELEAGNVSGPYAAATLLSFNRARSGDLYYQMKPYWVDRKTGTNHGSPYIYDTHVPLVFYGVGVKPGIYTEQVGVDDIAPTLANLLGVLRPPMSQGRVLF